MIEVCFCVCSRGTKKSPRSVKPQGEQPPQDQTPKESVKVHMLAEKKRRERAGRDRG